MIKKRKDGRFEARITVNGKRKSIYGKNEKELKEQIKKLESEITLNQYFEPSKINLESWLTTWLFDYKKGIVKPKTFESYEQVLRLYIIPELGPITLEKLNNLQIQQTINKMKVSPRTVKYTATIIKMALKKAKEVGLLKVNPADGIVTPTQRRKDVRVLDAEDLKKFLVALKGHRLGLAFYLAVTTGMRKGEILALRWSDIDFSAGTIKVERTISRVKTFDNNEIIYKTIEGTNKTRKSQRVLPILPELKGQLKREYNRLQLINLSKGERTNSNRLIFINKNGINFNPRKFTQYFYDLLVDAGIPHINFHALRHTFATLALQQGIELKVVADLLGHSSIFFTADTYIHTQMKKKREELDKLTSIFTSAGGQVGSNLGSNSKDLHHSKTSKTFNCAIGDSNPGPTD